jgi:hypothetical protein
MFKNNIKIAWRHLLKDREFTVLNVVGLSAGLACTILIYLWVCDEMSVDKFHAKDSQIYQLMEHRKLDGEITVSDESSGILSEILPAQMPEIEYAAALAPPSGGKNLHCRPAIKILKPLVNMLAKITSTFFRLM